VAVQWGSAMRQRSVAGEVAHAVAARCGSAVWQVWWHTLWQCNAAAQCGTCCDTVTVTVQCSSAVWHMVWQVRWHTLWQCSVAHGVAGEVAHVVAARQCRLGAAQCGPQPTQAHMQSAQVRPTQAHMQSAQVRPTQAHISTHAVCTSAAYTSAHAGRPLAPGLERGVECGPHKRTRREPHLVPGLERGVECGPNKHTRREPHLAPGLERRVECGLHTGAHAGSPTWRQALNAEWSRRQGQALRCASSARSWIKGKWKDRYLCGLRACVCACVCMHACVRSYARVCVSVRVCMHMCVCVCGCACVRVCVRVVYVNAWAWQPVCREAQAAGLALKCANLVGHVAISGWGCSLWAGREERLISR